MREVTKKAIEGYKNPGTPASGGKDLDPYRCPLCDKSMLREPWRCPEHGHQSPHYDQHRSFALASLSFEADSCGCYADSGLYEIPCHRHDPEELIEVLLDEIKHLEELLEAFGYPKLEES